MGSGALLSFVANNFDVLAGPLVTLVYPLYASVKAIETKSSVDDQQWLTYWVLYSLQTLFEMTFAKLIEWLPFWTYIKLIFNFWLVLPYFSGAAYVYEHFVRPLVLHHQDIIWFASPKRNIFSKPDDVLFAAEKFIEDNGPGAFEKLISKAGSMSKKSKKVSKHVRFADSEADKESKSWKMKKFGRFHKAAAYKESNPSMSNGDVAFHGMHVEGESSSWGANSSFMIFDDDNIHWN